MCFALLFSPSLCPPSCRPLTSFSSLCTFVVVANSDLLDITHIDGVGREHVCAARSKLLADFSNRILSFFPFVPYMLMYTRVCPSSKSKRKDKTGRKGEKKLARCQMSFRSYLTLEYCPPLLILCNWPLEKTYESTRAIKVIEQKICIILESDEKRKVNNMKYLMVHFVSSQSQGSPPRILYHLLLYASKQITIYEIYIFGYSVDSHLSQNKLHERPVRK